MDEILEYLSQNLQSHEDHLKRQIQYILGQLNPEGEEEDSSDEESDQEEEDEDEPEDDGEGDEEDELEGKVTWGDWYRRGRL